MYRSGPGLLRRGGAFLDRVQRVCFRGPVLPFAHATNTSYLAGSYLFLPPNEVFPFFELRSAGVNLTHIWEAKFDMKRYTVDMRTRVWAQSRELKAKGVRHAVLSAIGCDAFLNKSYDVKIRRRISAQVAALYAEALAEFAPHLDCVLFAIYDMPGCLPNYDIWAQVFGVAKAGGMKLVSATGSSSSSSNGSNSDRNSSSSSSTSTIKWSNTTVANSIITTSNTTSTIPVTRSKSCQYSRHSLTA
jgi:hypothetical protein